MKKYIDTSLLTNPLYEYLKWLVMKVYLQLKYWGRHLRIDYNTYVRRTSFGRFNYIGRNVFLVNCDIGDFTYISNDSTITHSVIGKFCSIGPGVKFAPGIHPTSHFVSTHPSTFSNPAFMKKSFTSKTMFRGNQDVTVGNDVWVGANSIILDGVNIGDGAIVAANSVVTRNVDPYCIVGGTPAKFLKKRFDDEDIEKLLRFKWWEKDDNWITANIQSMWNIKDFLK